MATQNEFNKKIENLYINRLKTCYESLDLEKQKSLKVSSLTSYLNLKSKILIFNLKKKIIKKTQELKDHFMNYNQQFHQFNTQFFEFMKYAEDTETHDKINADFEIQNDKISDMFTKQEKSIKDMMDPCLVSLERIHNQNSNLLEPIEHLTNEVTLTLTVFN